MKDNIKIYTNEDGEKYCKLSIILDIPIDDVDTINDIQVMDKLFEIDRSDIGEMILNVVELNNIITEKDNIPPTPDFVVPNRIKMNEGEIKKRKIEAENKLWEIFVIIVGDALKNDRKYTELFTNTEFNQTQLNTIGEIDGITLFYDASKRKYDIHIK
jgi:hypothetical protein